MDKLKIKGYLADNAPHFGAPIGEFAVQINPERFTHNKSVKYKEAKGSETGGTASTMENIDPEKVSFDLYFDGTGAIPGSKSVNSYLRSLKKIIYFYNGQIHAPNYIELIWGDFQFKCKLTSMDVDYTLFDTEGNPLRAKVKLSFEQHLTPPEVEAGANKNSPDLTHIKLVRIGDMLPLMCYEVYESSDYYLQVAEANGLTNFRSLEVGTSLFFPPIKK